RLSTEEHRAADAPMAIRDFQQLIRDRYFATDSARGAAGTFLWFSEEVGELAHALGKLETMESRVVPGLHLAGEVLDVDGRIGGFNFQWAWASGFVAGTSAVGAPAAQPT
ncbi:MAG: NAD(P)/FAD-dependent oxidoreductase, partial [Phycisphaerales bacterium]